MDRRGKMDFAGFAASGGSLIRSAGVFLAFLCCQISLLGQNLPTTNLPAEQIKELVAAERWQEVVDFVSGLRSPSADLDFYYGTALARLGRWDEARQAFLAGHRLRPTDERFLVELAGVEFKQKHYGQAAASLGRALKLAPQDSYANDFLGTVYFLQGNLAAALKYWNRVNKPGIETVRSEPTPKLNPVVLDRAFTFSPASTLRLSDLWTTKKRIEGLEIFPTYHMDLQAREDGKFDALFRNSELDGWGPNKWADLFRLLRGLPAQTVYPEYFNFRGRDLNFTSMYRWDAQKRRVRAGVFRSAGWEPGAAFLLGDRPAR